MHVVITGASSGIGRALALEYGKAGAKLTLVARRKPLLEEVAREVGRDCHIVEKDLSELYDVADWLTEAESVNGPIDVFVNNAGVMQMAKNVDLPLAAGQRMIDVCLSAPLRLSRAVLPSMLERGQGTIVQVASVAAFASLPGGSWYSATKAGFAAYSEALRLELRDTGVNVVTVYPGPVDTAMGDIGYDAFEPSRMAKSMPVGTPEVLAVRMRRAVERGSARLVYPRVYKLVQWFPTFSRWFTAIASPPLKATPVTAVRAGGERQLARAGAR